MQRRHDQINVVDGDRVWRRDIDRFCGSCIEDAAQQFVFAEPCGDGVRV